ncbi:MAG: hypothetical protein ACXWLR_01790, partial [Myxococcales bacterium]
MRTGKRVQRVLDEGPERGGDRKPPVLVRLRLVYAMRAADADRSIRPIDVVLEGAEELALAHTEKHRRGEEVAPFGLDVREHRVQLVQLEDLVLDRALWTRLGVDDGVRTAPEIAPARFVVDGAQRLTSLVDRGALQSLPLELVEVVLEQFACDLCRKDLPDGPRRDAIALELDLYAETAGFTRLASRLAARLEPPVAQFGERLVAVDLRDFKPKRTPPKLRSLLLRAGAGLAHGGEG